MSILELKDSGKFNDNRQAYQVVYEGHQSVLFAKQDNSIVM